MSELKNELEDEEAVAQDVVFPTANIEDDGQRGQVFDAAKAKEGLTRISSCVLPDHAYHQLYLNLVGKALIARGSVFFLPSSLSLYSSPPSSKRISSFSLESWDAFLKKCN
uniref:Uncharacterized protein n=1 Tax=Lotharella globosa TaxID=91324 RepID=A0A7S3YEL5_9EUKA